MNRFWLLFIYGTLLIMSFRASFYFNEQNNLLGYHGFGILGVFILGMYGDACVKHYRKTGKS